MLLVMRVREMVWSLPYKHENLYLGPHSVCKKPALSRSGEVNSRMPKACCPARFALRVISNFSEGSYLKKWSEWSMRHYTK